MRQNNETFTPPTILFRFSTRIKRIHRSTAIEVITALLMSMMPTVAIPHARRGKTYMYNFTLLTQMYFISKNVIYYYKVLTLTLTYILFLYYIAYDGVNRIILELL